MSDNQQDFSTVTPSGIEDLLKDAYLQYSMSVNVGRAIPDVRDGLKPGMRRVLFAMDKLNLRKGSSYMKCARVVGDVIGKYHPHGDGSVYDTMVRMAQDFSMRGVLIDGQGNFGSIDGDSAAAYRYTECRMERLAEELLTDLDKNTVDMQPTFDGSQNEPTVLPARYPNLLVNGTTGIGVGMATSIPPHNLAEVINATVALLEQPSITIEEMMQHLPGPDFPTAGISIGFDGIRRLYETGRGGVHLRGRAEIIEKNGREQIVITEIPYAVNKENMVKKIADLVNNKVITGISSLNDESSSRVGIRVVVGVKSNAMATVVLNQLYKHTQLAVSIGCQFLVVDNKQPKTLNLKQLLQAYLDHRLDVITRRIKFELEKAERRAHILEGLLKAVDHIDEVIKIIRGSANREDAHNQLKERFELSNEQAKAILDMRLSQLTGLAIDELTAEYEELMKRIAHYRELLANRQMRLDVVKEELIEVRDKFADERRTEMRPGERDINYEDLIARASATITISNEGYIKRVPTEIYRTQNRGGKGVKGMETKDDDFVKQLTTACTHDYIMFFTNLGRMHWLKVYDIPEAQRTSKGKAMVNLLEFEKGEYVRAMISVDKVDDEDRFIMMSTRNGVVKKTALAAFKNMRKKPIKAIVLDEDDDLIEAKLTDGNKKIILSTREGIACHFKESDCRTQGRVTRGCRGIRLSESDKVVAMSIVEESEDILVVTAKGMGKRSCVDDYRLTKRGAKGVRNIKLKEDDYVVEVMMIEDTDEIIMTTMEGLMVRISAEPIRSLGRASQGVTIMKFKKSSDLIISASRVVEVEGDKKEEELDEDGNPIVAPVELDEDGNPIVKEETAENSTESEEPSEASSEEPKEDSED
ncbi:DNA gyrase subunit A [Lentisphaera marina]|uniref:DNA gyrase subunit A n=1 Tax=Lentisphaera marina TaxID=1111041 RepID=UPI0023661F90|nr:DNA gyrase subunit A [Lentisphaera marina]MDD7984209.1 DNA gyrase subunit A [Lentisphaera marina]